MIVISFPSRFFFFFSARPKPIACGGGKRRARNSVGQEKSVCFCACSFHGQEMRHDLYAFTRVNTKSYLKLYLLSNGFFSLTLSRVIQLEFFYGGGIVDKFVDFFLLEFPPIAHHKRACAVDCSYFVRFMFFVPISREPWHACAVCSRV